MSKHDFRIDKPGIYPGIPDAVYFADPCPLPSLTQTISKLLLEASPRHAWHASAKLNPDWQPSYDAKFDAAHCAHAMLLGAGRQIEVIDAPDYRKKENQARKAIVINMGKIPVLRHVYEKSADMVSACRVQMAEAGIHFSDAGQSEVVVVWQEAGTWMRGKIDRLEPEAIIYDYKTTAGSASPNALAFKVADEGWDIQSAMYERGVVSLQPRLAGRVQQLRLVQETSPPFALNIARVDEATLTIGRQKLDAALAMWRQCLISKKWPTYNHGGVGSITIPPWALQRWEARQIGMVNPDTGEVMG